MSLLLTLMKVSVEDDRSESSRGTPNLLGVQL